MKKHVTLASDELQRNVRNLTSVGENNQLVFTFANFHLKPIQLKDEFNNHYDSEDQYVEKITILLDKALPLLSKERTSLFTTELQKAAAMHLHRVTDKKEIISDILLKYGFTSQEVDNIFEGENIYQLEVPYANGATRVVFQRIDNIISFLFMDPNHHVYMNLKKAEEAGSLFYEYCPVHDEGRCDRMNYLHTCFAFEFLDEDKYNATYGCSYDPSNTE